MKKSLLIVCLSFWGFLASAQLSVTGKHLLIEKNSIKILLFDKIDSNTNISYEGINVRIYKYNDLNSSVYSTTLFPPDDATGYVIFEDGVAKDTIWILDYPNYLPIYNSLAAENKPNEQCDKLNVLVDATIPSLVYKTPSGISNSLTREFTLSYNTLEWSESWKNKDIDSTIVLPATAISIDAPLCDTKFTLSGDQYAQELGLDLPKFTGSNYSAVAVKSNLRSILTIRAETNEAERPAAAGQLSGSAPMEIQFLSNANEPVARFYEWTIYKDGKLLINRTDKEHRYTFTETGSYKVKLVTSNDYCTKSDSITILVSESQIQVPNVFTPNGDGYNDEFRVAFKSIIKFDCWVYNRWGRLVYHWSDPTKGWDGKIAGKDASPAPYFYVIKAYGSDYDPNSVPDKVTRRRIGEFVLKGDINLLRGSNN